MKIEKLKQLASAATQGKWKKFSNEPCHREVLVTTSPRKSVYIPIFEMDINYEGDIGKEQKANLAYLLAAQPANITVLIEQHERMRSILNVLASWEEGAKVTGRFDNPEIAQIARDTLVTIKSDL